MRSYKIIRPCLVILPALLALFIGLDAHAADKPNIVLILSDDHGFMRHNVIQTPHLDKLAT